MVPSGGVCNMAFEALKAGDLRPVLVSRMIVSFKQALQGLPHSHKYALP